jgi:hypothetical protein
MSHEWLSVRECDDETDFTSDQKGLERVRRGQRKSEREGMTSRLGVGVDLRLRVGAGVVQVEVVLFL